MQFASISKNRGLALLAVNSAQWHASCFARDCFAAPHGHRATEAGNPALPTAQERAIEPGARELVEATDRAPTRQDAAGAAHETRVRHGYADEADEAGRG